MQCSLVFTNFISLTFSVSTEELQAHPFTDVTLSCHFSFVKGTENLEFSWEREDIKEEYEVEDDKENYLFFKYYVFFKFSRSWFTSFTITEQLEDQNFLYEGRVSVDQAEISQGTLSLLLINVDFMDEAIYKCSAITPDGRGKITIKLIVEGKGIYWMNLISSSVSIHKL